MRLNSRYIIEGLSKNWGLTVGFTDLVGSKYSLVLMRSTAGDNMVALSTKENLIRLNVRALHTDLPNNHLVMALHMWTTSTQHLQTMLFAVLEVGKNPAAIDELVGLMMVDGDEYFTHPGSSETHGDKTLYPVYARSVRRDGKRAGSPLLQQVHVYAWTESPQAAEALANILNHKLYVLD